MSKKIFILFVALIFTLTGCAAKQTPKDPWRLDMVTSMGGMPDEPTVQKLEYRIDVSYIGDKDAEMIDVKPLISGQTAVSSRIIDESLEVVEKKRTHMSIKGRLMITTGTLTKKQINEMGPFITGITINWQENGKIHETTRILNN